MVNCNPETVSTDYDTSTASTSSRSRSRTSSTICEVEQPEGVIVQFGGQTPLRLAPASKRPACRSSAPARRDRPRRGPRPLRRAARASSASRRRRTRRRTGRRGAGAAPERRLPGARAPELRARRPRDGDRLRRSTACATTSTRGCAGSGREILLDKFLEDAIEVDVDALCDGEDVWIGGIMEHIEEAGIHSGDSACVLPPHSLGAEMLDQIRERHARHRAGARRRRPDQRPVRGATATAST